MLDLFGIQLRPDPAHRATSKAWVAETLALSDNVTMLVTELH
ncbi:hypothetical protein [Candidatus Chloroploca asiatica]|nr:hypothetical protein [Candidatus Chloroploca asiatica]